MRTFPFDNSYARLPAQFSSKTDPTVVADAKLIVWNSELAASLGLRLDGVDETELAAIFSGNVLPDGAEPIAMAYAGHQFGAFSPQLGDGRAILLGEVVDDSGARHDVQLKGSGRTPFSRRGDGRAALGPVLREYLVSEAMHALGVPTTRALAAVTTGEPVFRETTLPGAILTRVASSHVRVGTFEFFASRGDTDSVGQLVTYVLERHFPELQSEERPGLALLDAVAERQASLVAQWMGLGFVHGVMNTDNTSIVGETIDYGPCAFLDYYDAAACFSSIDHGGRYAFANQAPIAQWNLTRLAESLLPQIDPDAERAVELASEVIRRFATRFDAAYLDVMRAKLGLSRGDHRDEEDRELAQQLLAAMQESKADFTRTFRGLADAAERPEAHVVLRTEFVNEAAYDAWVLCWDKRLNSESRSRTDSASAMRAANARFIPRNHLVEEALSAAIEEGDYAPFHALHAVLTHPFDEQPEQDRYAEPGAQDQCSYRTYCGT